MITSKLNQNEVALLDRLMANAVEPADAIIFLQGDRLDRAEKVLELFRMRLAPIIVLSGNNAMMERRLQNNENDMYLKDLEAYLRERGVPSTAIIIDDQSMNTKDQAANVICLARERDWQKLILVTSAYHLLRAHLTFLKQKIDQRWTGSWNWQHPTVNWEAIPSGRSKTARQMLEEELCKIKRYANDLAPISDTLLL